MDELIKLGNNIRAERSRLHLSQEEFAEKIDIRTSHVSNIENGKVNVKFTTLLTIMKVLNVPFEKLYDFE